MKLLRKLEDLFSASAFAEAGDFDTARKLASDRPEPARRRRGSGGIRLRQPRMNRGRLTSRA